MGEPGNVPAAGSALGPRAEPSQGKFSSLLRDPRACRGSSVRPSESGHPGARLLWNGCVTVDVSVT